MARIVVASNLGGTAETIIDGESGFLVQPNDVKAWAAAFQRALTLAPVERAAMGTAAWTRIREHYSMRAMCEETFDLYARLSEGRR
jgi:glycosyltransferase involved in cell wall biosynthesis